MTYHFQTPRFCLLTLALFSTIAAATVQRSGDRKDAADTQSLDIKIAKAEVKAALPNSTDGDRRAAAAAYLERGNVYYTAAMPRLYKFALGDFRRALKYQPDLAEAREKADQIISIYRSMARPIPFNGTEPPERANETVAGARRMELKSGIALAPIKDEIEAGAIKDYVFCVPAGQTISISTHAEKQVAGFNLYQVYDGALIRRALDVAEWTGEIKQAGDYVLRVGPAREKSTYALEIKISKTPVTRKF